MLVLLGHRHHEAQVGVHQLLLCTLTSAATLANLLCQLYLLFDGNHGHATDFNKILVERLAAAVGNAFTDF